MRSNRCWGAWRSHGFSYSTYYAMVGPMLPNGFIFSIKNVDSRMNMARADRMSAKQEYVDQDAIGGFSPPRVPTRISSKLIPARESYGREITDLLMAKPHAPPAMAEVDLDDSRFRSAPMVRSTLVIKRKGTDSYNGRLCVRGATAPLQTAAPASSPTAHRCSVKLRCAIASQIQWAIRAIGISQAFLQSSNLNPNDRVVANPHPPPMTQLPRRGILPPMNRDISKVTHNRGFLLPRPLYGGRDASMRRFLALSKRLVEHGFTQMKSDVCVFSKRDKNGVLTGCLISHVDDLLFCGTPQFRVEAIRDLKTSRKGEVEALTREAPIISTGMMIELESPTTILLPQQMYAVGPSNHGHF